MNRRELSDACGIPYSTLSKYTSERTPPDIEAVRKICCALPEDERGPLIAARAADEVPPEFRHLLWIEVKGGALAEQPAPYQPRELPADLRGALEKLAAAAAENEEWAKAVKALADLV